MPENTGGGQGGDPYGIGSAVVGLANIAADWKTAQYNRQHDTDMQNRGYRQNRKMTKYAFNLEKEMWDAKNLYNSPAQQMQRLKEGKLNPNLVYGKGIENTSGGQLPQYNAPTADFSGISSGTPPMGMLASGLDQYLDTKAKITQNQTLQAQMRQEDVKAHVAEQYGKLRAGYETEDIGYKALSSQYKGKLDFDKLRKNTGEGGLTSKPYQYLENELNFQMLQDSMNIKGMDKKYYGFGKHGKGIQAGYKFLSKKYKQWRK